MFIQGDARKVLPTLHAGSVQMCVTSPPYWQHRSYGGEGEIGQEETPNEYILALCDVFKEIHRITKDNATLWINIADTRAKSGIKKGTLLGIPYRLVSALQMRGWFLMQEIIWQKPNPMPSSIKKRCTASHEMIFMFAKNTDYLYNQLREEAVTEVTSAIKFGGNKYPGNVDGRYSGNVYEPDGFRNMRDVWSIVPSRDRSNHLAPFPQEIPRRAIMAGSNFSDVVIDPFAGTGTTIEVAEALGRKAIGIDVKDNQ